MVQYGRPRRSSWQESVWSSFGRTIMGKAIWENPIETWLEGNSKLGMSLCTPWKRGYSYLCMWMTSNWLARNKTLMRCGKCSMKKTIWENQHLSLIMKTWAALKDNAKKAKIQWTFTKPCSNREFPRCEQRNCHSLKIFVFLHGLMTWLVMQTNVWNDVVSWRTRRHNNSTMYLLHASMTTSSQKKNWNPWENCHKYALKLF